MFRRTIYAALLVLATVAIPASLPERADAQFFVRGRGFAVGVGYPTYYYPSYGYYSPGYYGYYGTPYYNYGPRYYGYYGGGYRGGYRGYRYWR